MAKTRYFWDPVEDNVTKEYDENGDTLVRYTTEPALYGNLISQERDGVARYYHFDGQGSTLALTNKDGDITDEYAYNAFGETTEENGNTENSRRYSGERGYEHDSFGYFVRARVYSPAIARWLSSDPLFAVGPNPYTYCDNSPIVLFDFDGQQVIKESLTGADKQVWTIAGTGNEVLAVDIRHVAGIGRLYVNTAVNVTRPGIANPNAIVIRFESTDAENCCFVQLIYRVVTLYKGKIATELASVLFGLQFPHNYTKGSATGSPDWYFDPDYVQRTTAGDFMAACFQPRCTSQIDTDPWILDPRFAVTTIDEPSSSERNYPAAYTDPTYSRIVEEFHANTYLVCSSFLLYRVSWGRTYTFNPLGTATLKDGSPGRLLTASSPYLEGHGKNELSEGELEALKAIFPNVTLIPYGK
jgi:RHS repeat-associated protein